MDNKRIFFFLTIVGAGIFILFPAISLASFESSLQGIQNKMTTVILPALSVIGLIIAGGSFAMGNPNAKQHIIYAIVGACCGFGAQAIVDFIRSIIH